jgi:hypothetical protein
MFSIGAMAQIEQYMVNRATYPIVVNGQHLDTIAFNMDGRTYLSLRDIAVATDTNVEWNGELNRVEIGESENSELISFLNIDNVQFLIKDNKKYISMTDIDTIKLPYNIKRNQTANTIDILNKDTVIIKDIPTFYYLNRTYISYDLLLTKIDPLLN